MTGPLGSIIGSVALWVAGALVMWLSQHGVVSPDQAAQDTTVISGLLVSGVTVAASAALVWWKSQQNTQTAVITAVNNDKTNGVKVVPETSPTPAVSAPVPMAPPISGK